MCIFVLLFLVLIISLMFVYKITWEFIQIIDHILKPYNYYKLSRRVHSFIYFHYQIAMCWLTFNQVIIRNKFTSQSVALCFGFCTISVAQKLFKNINKQIMSGMILMGSHVLRAQIFERKFMSHHKMSLQKWWHCCMTSVGLETHAFKFIIVNERAKFLNHTTKSYY